MLCKGIDGIIGNSLKEMLILFVIRCLVEYDVKVY